MTSPPAPLRVALVGCGSVSRKYLKTLVGDSRLIVTCCSDIDPTKAQQLAEEYGLAASKSLGDVLADPSVDLILNLTNPSAHADVTLRALSAGKHVYTEKPLAASLADAEEIVDVARTRGLWVGCAPDTFLGSGIQAMRAMIESGQIGRPILAQATLLTDGPERFHPGPEFLYGPSAGPLFDVGPYLVNTLTYLLGPVSSVSAVTATPIPDRIVAIGHRKGEVFRADASTLILSTLEFANGAFATLSQSWDIVGTTAPALEIHGTAGSILGTPSDSWDGTPRLKLLSDQNFNTDAEAPNEDRRPAGLGVGLLQMSEAVRAGVEPAASVERGLHTLRVLLAIAKSGATGARVMIQPARAEEAST